MSAISSVSRTQNLLEKIFFSKRHVVSPIAALLENQLFAELLGSVYKNVEEDESFAARLDPESLASGHS